MDHMTLWNDVEKTDPAYTKAFNRGGGFKGTATNATYLAKRATEHFGPCGIGWGIDVVDERYIEGAPIRGDNGEVICREIVHVVYAKLWYVINGQRGEIYQYGQTTFVGRNKYGPFTDEEAPKKSLTDAMSKSLSRLGFSADVHLGLYDDNKYVAERRKEEAAKRRPFQADKANGGGNPPFTPELAKATCVKELGKRGLEQEASESIIGEWIDRFTADTGEAPNSESYREFILNIRRGMYDTQTTNGKAA